jgi:hypothetical protein
MPTREDCIRLAMAIDCEGSIQITRLRARNGCKNPPHMLLVNLANTDMRLPLWCRQTFGGTFYMPKVLTGYQKKKMWCWQITAGKAEEIIRMCLPYFIIKREQAEVALLFRETYKPRHHEDGVPVEVIEQRDKFKVELSRLKKELPAQDALN